MAGSGSAKRRWLSLQGTAGAAALLVTAWVFFTIEMVTVRILASDLSIQQITFVRVATQLVLLLPFMVARPRQILKTPRFPLHLLRAICSTTAMQLYYWAFAILPFAAVTTVTFTQALFLVILAALIGREVVGPRRWIATFIGFLGVLIIMRPGSGLGGHTMIDPTMFIPLTGAVTAAALMLLTRKLGLLEHWMTIMGYVGLLGTALLIGPALWTWQPVQAEHWWPLLAVGVLGTCGQFLFVQAFSRAEASALAPIDYLRLIFAVIAGYVMFNELPDLWTWVGALIIIASALTVTRLEQRAEQRRLHS